MTKDMEFSLFGIIAVLVITILEIILANVGLAVLGYGILITLSAAMFIILAIDAFSFN